jgi:hypothetical protein
MIRKAKDLLNDPAIGEPWPDFFVKWNKQRDPKIVEQLAAILNEAKDEKSLQKFYTEHPYLLAIALRPHYCWVFPLPRLGGGQHIPDFLYCDQNSLGYQWTLIELESPTMDATNQDGSISKDCHHAVQQILDYRGWLRDNALAEQKTYPSLSERCDGYVLIGRRDGGRTELEQKRLAEFKQQRIEIGSYDRLLYQAKEHLQHINRGWEESAKAAEEVRAIKERNEK